VRVLERVRVRVLERARVRVRVRVFERASRRTRHCERSEATQKEWLRY